MKKYILISLVLTINLQTIFAQNLVPEKPWQLTASTKSGEIEPVVLAYFQKLIPLGLTIDEVREKLKSHSFHEFAYNPDKGVNLSNKSPSTMETGALGSSNLLLFADVLQNPSEEELIYLEVHFAFNENRELISIFTQLRVTRANDAERPLNTKPWKLTPFTQANEIEPVVLNYFQKLIPLGLRVEEVKQKLKSHSFNKFEYDAYNGVNLASIEQHKNETARVGVTTLRLFADTLEIPSEFAIIYVLAYFAFDEDGKLIGVFSKFAIDGI